MRKRIIFIARVIFLILIANNISWSQTIDPQKNVPDPAWPERFSQARQLVLQFECSSNDSHLCPDREKDVTRFFTDAGYSPTGPQEKIVDSISIKVRISAYNLSAIYVNALGAYPMSLNTGFDVSIAFLVNAQDLKPYEISAADKQDPPHTSEWGVDKAGVRTYSISRGLMVELFLRMRQAERLKVFLAAGSSQDLGRFEYWKKDLYPLILPELNNERDFKRYFACELLSRWVLITPEVIARMKQIPKREMDDCSRDVLATANKRIRNSQATNARKRTRRKRT